MPWKGTEKNAYSVKTHVMLTSMLFIKHVGFKFNPVVAVDIESLYYILRLLKCTRDKEETIQPSTNIEMATLSKKRS